MKTVVIGGNGFIAKHLPYEKSSYRFEPNEWQIRNFFQTYKPDVVINCIGYCGSPNIDKCETNKIETYTKNITLPLMIASECAERGVKFIHFSSGCIFNGTSPNAEKILVHNDKVSSTYKIIEHGWKETDKPNPVSYYSETKYACELAISSLPNVCTIRLRMPISTMRHPRNLISKLLGYKQVLRAQNSITFLDDLKNAVDWVITNNKTGTYHIASPKPLYHEDILNEYRKYVPEHTYETIYTDDLDKITKAKRSNCILDVSKAINEGFAFNDTWEELSECVYEYVKK